MWENRQIKISHYIKPSELGTHVTKDCEELELNIGGFPLESSREYLLKEKKSPIKTFGMLATITFKSL